MSLEIGGLPPIQPPAATRRPAESPGSAFSLPRADTAELSFPAYPPAEVLDAVGAAADRVDALAAANRELHFRVDDESGRVVVEVRDFEGRVIRTIPPSEALEVMAGASI
jgi:FlaG protein